MYTTPGEVYAVARDTSLDSNLLMYLIPSISEAIDQFCHRTFTVERRADSYDFQEARELTLRADLVKLVSVTTTANQTIAASAFTLEPKSGPPYRRLILKTSSGESMSYSTDTADAITVLADWGYKANIPPTVRLAASLWVLDIYNHVDAWGFTGVSDGTTQATLTELLEEPPAPVKALLKPHRKVRIEALV